MYDAVNVTNKRRPPTTILRSEDNELLQWQRGTLISTTRDLMRNFAAARWAVAKHLDYVSHFHFRARNGDPELDRQLADLVTWWSEPQNCDVAERHSLEEMTRLIERTRVVDGDILVVKLKSGQIQLVEGDRVRTPYDWVYPQEPKEQKVLEEIQIPEEGQLINGVVVDAAGKTMGYCLAKRLVYNQFGGSGGFVFDRFVKADNAILYGVFDRVDQYRGISELAAALNPFKDVLEAQEYALLKAKLISLWALLITRSDSTDTFGRSTYDTSADPSANKDYTVDLGQGPFSLDMAPGDDARFLESGHPSANLKEFLQSSLGIALKALDIPLSFYDEAYTNYSGARQALVMYLQSIEVKRRRLKRVLNDLLKWKLIQWVADGQLSLPAGMTVDQVQWDWVGAATPWIDPEKEYRANQIAIDMKLDSRTRICRESGIEFEDVVKDQAQELELMKQYGIQDVPPKAPPVIQTKEIDE